MHKSTSRPDLQIERNIKRVRGSLGGYTEEPDIIQQNVPCRYEAAKRSGQINLVGDQPTPLTTLQVKVPAGIDIVDTDRIRIDVKGDDPEIYCSIMSLPRKSNAIVWELTCAVIRQ